MKKEILISLIFVIAIICLTFSISASDNTYYRIYTPPDVQPLEDDISAIPIYFIDIPASVGIKLKETKKLNENIKRILYNSMVFEIRELTLAGQNIWTTDLLDNCQDIDCLIKFAEFIKVDKIILAQASSFDKNHSVSLAMFDVKSKSFEKTISKGCNCSKDKFEELLYRSMLEVVGLDIEISLADAQQKEKTVPKDTRQPKSTQRCPDNMEYIPGGEIEIGNESGKPKERPAHLVTINGFCLDPYIVTVGDYTNEFPAYAKINTSEHDFPATSLTQTQAAAYCRQLGRRLPTEVEWELACRGPDKFLYPYGNKYLPNKCLTGDVFMGKVGAFAECKSAYNIFDMSGLVWEYTSSSYQPYPYDADDGREALKSISNRALRGGSFRNRHDDVSCTNRLSGSRDARDNATGFRCASDAIQ